MPLAGWTVLPGLGGGDGLALRRDGHLAAAAVVTLRNRAGGGGGVQRPGQGAVVAMVPVRTVPELSTKTLAASTSASAAGRPSRPGRPRDGLHRQVGQGRSSPRRG